MKRKEREFITLRFRRHLDDDLKEAVETIEDGMLSNLVRDGLRLMLGIRTSKRIEVTERVISLPVNTQPTQHIEAHGTEHLIMQQKEAATHKPAAPYLTNRNNNSG